MAYGSLLQERRRVLHARIVEVLEGLPRTAGRAGGTSGPACRPRRGVGQGPGLWPAGRGPGGRTSAYREAVAYFEQALAAYSISQRPRTRWHRAIDLRCDLHNAMLRLDEQGSIFDHLRTAEALAERLGDDQQLGRISGYLC